MRLALLSLLCALFSLCACQHDAPSPSPPAGKFKRTVLIYMAAQNSLAYFNQQDSLEILRGAPYLRAGERLLFFVDRGQGSRLYELTQGDTTPRLARDYGADLNSAQASTLQTVLRDMHQHYPSESYGLVLWSHATGWLPSPKSPLVVRPAQAPQLASLRYAAQNHPQSFGLDVGAEGKMHWDLAALGEYADEIDLPDLATAIQQSGIPLRFLLFDCCLMQDIESLYALRHCADYIAGAPIEIAAEGGNYTDLLYDGLFATDIAQLGHSYARHYTTGSLAISGLPRSDFGLVFSIVRTDRLEALRDSVKRYLPSAFARNATGQPQYPQLEGVQHYEVYTADKAYRPHFYDLRHSLLRILPTAEGRAAIQQALNALIVFSAHTPRFNAGLLSDPYRELTYQADSACGIAAFIPQAIYEANATQTPRYHNHNLNFRHTSWYADAGWREAGW